MEKQLSAVLRTVISYLDQQGLRYAMIGGLALSHWGVVRATYDIDIKLMVPDNDYPAIRATLQRTFSKSARPELPQNSLVVAVTADGVIVDFLLALPGYEELIIERAIPVDLGGWSVMVCTAEDLLIQKVVAGREKDWLDIELLLTEQLGNLDEAYIEEWIAQFAEALESNDMVVHYQRLVRQARAS